LGDIRLELSGLLEHQAFTDITRDRLLYGPLQLTVAGTAVNAARSLARRFAGVTVAGKVGADDIGRLAIAQIRSIGAQPVLISVAHVGTGLSVVLRDAPRDGASRRLLVSGIPTPLATLAPADVQVLEPAISSNDLFLTDGYCMLWEQSRQAVVSCLRIARHSGRRACLDLVPHDIDSRLAVTDLSPALELADMVVIEATTLARLLEAPAGSYVEDHAVDGLVPAIADQPWAPLWMIRYGYGGISTTAVVRRGAVVDRYETGYASVSPAHRTGFGDEVTATDIQRFL